MKTNKAKKIVADGYDQIAIDYLEWTKSTRTEERAKYTKIIFERIPKESIILELGCGSGIPTTQKLACKYNIVGVDISKKQIMLARINVPGVSFVIGDIAQLAFKNSSVDAVIAFYSLIHVPRQEQPALFRRIATWLKPNGYFIGSLGVKSDPIGYEENWFGVPMFWSSFDRETYKQIIQASGFSMISAQEETSHEFGKPVTFLWIVAQKNINKLLY
jgi:SAM-dependent methyltransferase